MSNLIQRRRIWSVYGLYDPRDGLKIQYVGCTVGLVKTRLQNHLSEALLSFAETPKLEWIRQLIREGIDPKFVVLEETTKDLWEGREAYWIRALPDLLNQTPGGVGVRVMAESTKKALLKANLGKKQKRESVEKRKQSNAGFRHTAEAKAKISATHKGVKRGALPDDVKAKLSESISSLIWVNDGFENRRVQKTVEIPKGWVLGRHGRTW